MWPRRQLEQSCENENRMEIIIVPWIESIFWADYEASRKFKAAPALSVDLSVPGVPITILATVVTSLTVNLYTEGWS